VPYRRRPSFQKTPVVCPKNSDPAPEITMNSKSSLVATEKIVALSTVVVRNSFDRHIYIYENGICFLSPDLPV
jgi:hypothetical protein